MERKELQQAEELLTQMKYNQALQIVESIEKKETLTQDDLLKCQILIQLSYAFRKKIKPNKN